MTRERDLEAVRVQGKRIRTAELEVRYIASPLHRPRVGVIVPRFGHTAVARNALKRQLRELVRIELLPLMPAVDVVVRALPSAYGASFDALRSTVQRAGGRLPRAMKEGAS